MGSLHLFPVEKFLLLLLRPLRVEGIYSQKLKVCFGACLDSTVGAAGQDRGSCGLCHNLPLHPRDNWEEPLAESMAGVKAGPCCCSLSGPKSKSRGRSARSPCRVPHSGIFHSVSPTITPVGKGPGSKSKRLMFAFLPSLRNFPSWVAQGSCRPGK